MRTRLILTVFAALVIVLAAAAGHSAAQTRGMGTMNGTVTDEGGNPIEGAEVRTAIASGGRVECKSDAEGAWKLGGLGRGEWEIVVVKTGFMPKALRVVLQQELARTDPIKVVLKKA